MKVFSALGPNDQTLKIGPDDGSGLAIGPDDRGLVVGPDDRTAR